MNKDYSCRMIVHCTRFGGLTHARPGPPVLESEALNYTYRYTRADCPGKWTKIVNSSVERETTDGYSDSAAEPEDQQGPVSRYAHQVVYYPFMRTAYVHGGNDGLGRDDVAEGPDYDGLGEQGPPRSDAGTRARGVATSLESRLDDFWSMRLQR